MIVAALALIPIAYAAQSAKGATEMRFACAKKRGGELRYVARQGACSKSERLIRFRRDDAVIACARRGGNVYRVGSRRACRRAPHAPSLTYVLPDDQRRSFCAHKRTGALRSIEHVPYDPPRPRNFGGSSCKDNEKRVFVKRANRRPRAADDAATTDEGSAAGIDVLANDRDPEGRRLRVASVDAGSVRGTVAVAADRRSIAYDPSGRFEALGVGASATETFTYRVTDGRRRDRAGVTVTVQGLNDAPNAAGDAASTNENAATTLAVLANDSDVDQGDSLSVSAVDTTGTAGAVTISPDGTLRYDPAGRLDDLRPGDTRIDRFAYTISDGHGGTAGATASVSVSGVNDAPVVTTSAGDTAYTEGGAATLVDPALTVSDADDASLAEATATIAGVAAGDLLHFTDQSGITGDYNPGTGVLTLSGTASVADYQAALRSIEFSTTDDDPASAKPVAFTVDDGGADSAPAAKGIAVTPVNDAPIVTTSAGALGYTEGDPATPVDPGLLLTDPDSTQISGATVQITGNHANPEDVLALPLQPGIAGAYNASTGMLTLTGTDTVANYEAALRAVTYRNASTNPSIAPRTLTFIASDASNPSSPATRDINVSSTDNAPDVDNSAGALAYAENDGATAIDTAITITDPDSANLTGATVQITGNYVNGQDVLALPAQPVVTASFDALTGRLTLDGTATVAAYETALEAVTYENTSDDPSTAARTVTYAARDAGGFGAADTHGITIAADDDDPVAVDESATVAEDAGATAVPVLANDTDVDAGPKTISSASDPANGTVVLTGGAPGAHTGLTYQPDPNYCNAPPGTSPDTFTYTLNGGDSATVSVTVTCVDDPPVAVNDSATVGEDSGANAIDVLANDTDVDGGPGTVQSVSDPANGAVVVTGGGTGLTYQPDGNYCNSPPGTSPDTFTYTLNGGSTAMVSVTVTCADDMPVAVNDAPTVVEDSSANSIDVLANDTDVDGGTKAIASASDPANGTVVLTGGSPGAHTGLTYQPDPNYCNDHAGGTADTFTYTLNGGSTATVSLTVECTPDDPVVDTSAGATSYTENDPATPIDSAVTVTDPDPGASTITGATAQITGGYAGAQDILALAGSHPGITPAFSGDTLTLTGDAGPAAYQAALRDVTYRNGSEDPSTAARTVTFTVTDAAGSGSDTKGVTVISVDDPPVAINDSATVLEDAAATTVPVLTNDTDVDGGPKTISSASDPANGSVVLTGGSPGAHTGLTYQPDPNYCNDPPATTPDTFTYTVNGGSSATVSMTVTCVNDAPVADDETFNGNDSAHGNTTLQVDDPDDNKSAPTHPHTEITGDILAGDTDIDGPGPLTVTPGTFATNDGGSVTIESDGDFTFHPAASTSCTDTSDFFDYTVEDSGSPEQTDTGRVTIAIAGCVWYVSNDAAGDSGTSAAPFDTLAQAETASGANHTVFVFDGDNTATGLGGDGYAMNAGERLIGEHEGLVVDPDGGGALTADTLHPASANAHPTLTATSADVIDLDDGNEVRGLNVDPQNAGGIAGGAGDTGGGTIDDVNVVDTLGSNATQAGLELSGTTGTFNITNLAVNSNAAGVLLTNAGTTDFGSTTIVSNGLPGLSASGTNMSTSTFDAITVNGSSNGGVGMTNTTGTTVFGDGTGVDLALSTASGTTPAFALSNAGAITVAAAGVDNVSANGGPAIDVTGTTVSSLEFDDVDSTNSAGDGINVAGLGTAGFSATSGTIAGAAGIAFDLDGGSGTITYPGDLNNGSGQAAEITGRGGGTVTLSGPIADTADAGGGINLSGNTGGSTTFSNASKVLNTTTANAVSFTGSDGHTLTLSGGGLDVDTTTGQGIVAATSGTINVQGSGNTVTSTTGRAVNIQSTDFGTGGFTLQSVSSNGAPNGILLNATGTTAGMTITGTGANNSGGSIQNATEHGVSLTSTRDFNADELSISGANFAGVDGTGVTNFTYTDGEVTSAGDSLTNDLHAAFAFNDVGANNVNGQLTITGNTVTNPYGGGVNVRNASGTISQASVSSNTLQSTSDPATSKQDGVSFHIEGTPTTAAGLTQAAISNNTITNFPSGNGVELVGEQITSTAGPRASFGVPDSTTNRVVVSGNDIRGNATNKMGVFGVAASVTGMADGNVRIANNGTAAVPMQNIVGEGIGVGASGTANADFIVENNFVAPGNVLGNVGISANANRRQVGATIVATPDVNATIQNNTVSNTSGAGIKVLHFNSNGNLRAKIVNNTVGAPVQPNPGIAVENGSSNDAAFNPTLCAQISGNPATGSGPDGFGNTFPGIDLIERGGSNTTYRLQLHGLTPNPATPAQTESYLAGQNPASSLGGGFYAGKRASVSEGNQFEACTITF